MTSEPRTVIVEVIDLTDRDPRADLDDLDPLEDLDDLLELDELDDLDELDPLDDLGRSRPQSEAASASRTAALVAPAPPDPDYFVG